jgi:hypothetical protein
MKALPIAATALVVAAALGGTAVAAPVPFPSEKAGPAYIAARTTTANGELASWFKPGDTVVFRAYAINRKTTKLLQKSDVQFFYVTIPGQPNVKLAYNPAPQTMKGYPWVGQWTVPLTAAGQINFRILVKTKDKQKGEFVQMPVASSQLNISSNAQPIFGPAPSAVATSPSGKPTMGLYVDSVNGTRPAGAAPRLVGCSQTNVFKRGEQFVLRAWGFDLKSGELLTNENVNDAHFSVPGIPDVKLNWGSHGTAPNQVFFWTNFWNIPATFPLGTTTVKVSYTLLNGTQGSLDYEINIIP